ncbi:MAG: AMP-binding protein, partial [Pseudomonadota bacterium]
MLIERGETYEEVYGKFSWNVPEKFNIADYVCDRWAGDPERIALIYEDQKKTVHRYSFADVQKHANQFANTLLSIGLKVGDRVMLLLAQDPECAISHVGCFKAGIISSPTSVLFGADAIAYRLNDSGASAVVTDMANLEKVLEAKSEAPNLKHIFVIDGHTDEALPYWETIAEHSDQFTNVDSAAEDTAWISYTSGTTGMPKGSVQPHRMLLGHMPSLEFVYDFFPQDKDALWSPADWAWMAGLADILLPGWFHGCTVVATAMKGFEPEEAYRVLDQHDVTLALLTPTMLKLMRQVPDALDRYNLKLRAVLSGG